MVGREVGVRTRTLITGVLVLAVLAGAAVATGWYLEADDPASPSGPDPRTVQPPAGLDLPAARRVAAVLPAPEGPPVTARAVRDRLAGLVADDDLGRHVGVAVTDLGRDEAVATLGEGGSFVPASTLKLVTAAAVLETLGPAHRFTTSVRLDRSGAGPPRVVLVGGGDPLLARSEPAPGDADAPDVPAVVSVDVLADVAAAALGRTDLDRVRVGYDASLFSGPAASPDWEPSYVPEGIVSPVSALWVDRGLGGRGLTERSADPAASAADYFARRLQAEGLDVLGRPAPVRRTSGDELAAEQGAPLEDVVAHALQTSDNEVSEVLLRHVGLATGRPGSFAGGAAGVRETLTGLGLPWRGVVVQDGSGLSRGNRVTLLLLTEVLALGADPERPRLRTVVAALPAARFGGSLAARFLEPGTESGRGVVRAKTGTLTGVHNLAGAVVTRSGTLLGFALLTDRVRLLDTLDARAQLDRIAAALARCGCS